MKGGNASAMKVGMEVIVRIVYVAKQYLMYCPIHKNTLVHNALVMQKVGTLIGIDPSSWVAQDFYLWFHC